MKLTAKDVHEYEDSRKPAPLIDQHVQQVAALTDKLSREGFWDRLKRSPRK